MILADLQAVIRDMRIVGRLYPTTVTAGDLLSFADRIETLVQQTATGRGPDEHPVVSGGGRDTGSGAGR